MHEYIDELKDPLRFGQVDLTTSELIKSTKKLLCESRGKIGLVGLALFFARNLAHPVSRLLIFHSYCFI